MNRANIYTINLPLLPNWEGRPNPEEILNLNPLRERKAVETIARYFRREFGYDVIQYDARCDRDGPDKTVAFLWHLPSYEIFEGVVIIGACCFRWRKWTNHPPGWALQWVWFHPYERNRGHLTEAWPGFCQRFGAFFVEPPLSPAMKSFLKSRGHELV